MRPLVVLVAVLVAGAAHTAALSFSAAWGFNSPEDLAKAPNFATHTFDTANLTAIQTNHARFGVKALYPLSWVEGRKEPCYAPITRMRGNFSCVKAVDDLQGAWDTAWALIQPLVKQGIVEGVFLGDEHIYFGVMPASYNAMIAIIRKDWPNAILYSNHAPDVLMCGFNKLNQTVFTPTSCFPDVDLISLDFYGGGTWNSTWTVPEYAFSNLMLPRLPHPDQRLIHVTTGYTQPSPSLNLTAFDEFCALNAREFLKFGLANDYLAGLFPFYYPSSASMIGLSDLPKCWETWQAIGSIVRASGGNTNTSMPRPTPPATCGPTSPPPDWWSWCGRQ